MSVYNIYIFPGPVKPLNQKALEELFGNLLDEEIGIVYLDKLFTNRSHFAGTSAYDFHIELMSRTEDGNPHIEMLWLYEKYSGLPAELQQELWRVIKAIAADIDGAYITEGLGVSDFYQRFIDIDGTRYIDNAGFAQHYYRGTDTIHLNKKNGGLIPVHPNIKFLDVEGDWERYELDDTIFEDGWQSQDAAQEISFAENSAAKAILDFYIRNYEINPSGVTLDSLAEKFPLITDNYTPDHIYSWLGLGQAQLQTHTVQQKTISVIEELLLKRIEVNFDGAIPEEELNHLTPKISMLLHLLHQAACS